MTGRRIAWGKYPENPVNPVKKIKNKIESIPLLINLNAKAKPK
jgi:hypothetical protein